MLTADILRAALPAVRSTDIARFVTPLTEACAEWGIDRPLRLAAFLAQIAHESGQFRAQIENLNYSAEALLRVFPRHFIADQAVTYARQPERIAARAYANRMGNGDEASGDGWRYRGRGLIQITGRSNYAACGAALGLDLIGLTGFQDRKAHYARACAALEVSHELG